MSAPFDDPGLVVIGAARGAELALARLLKLLPAPFPAPVVIAIQNGTRDDVERLLELGPPELRLAHEPLPLLAGEMWLAPAGTHLLVDGETLVPSRSTALGERTALAPLFASASGRRVLGVLLGDTGADGAVAAAALGDQPLLRPDPDRIPSGQILRVVDQH